ncbi:class I SAM-dependent methyltransferase [Thermodesulfobacteriota bacterium]
MFKRYLPHLTNKTILDVGCGHGMMMEYFSKKGNNVFGIDITHQSIKYITKKGVNAIEADARFIPFENNTFDLVYSLGVIEHFAGTELALQEQVRVCAPGGVVVAVVPYLLTPFSVLSIIFERITKKEHNLIVTYGKAYSKSKLLKMFQTAGCERVKIEPYYGSAFLQIFTNQLNRKLIDFLENSFLSRYLGLVLWGIGYKGSDI